MDMENQKKLQVFISSTYTDLLAERQTAVEAVLEAGHIPAGMELFAASDKSQWEIIERWIDESDIYLLILGGRYGSIEKISGKSYTHLEYEYAQSKNKPLFAIVIDEDKLSTLQVKDSELVNPNKLKDFREIVLQKMSSFFSDNKDIKLEIHRSLNRIRQDYKLSGWIRGNEENSDFAKEIMNLNDEMRKLREENEKLKAEQVERSPKLKLSINDDQSLEFKLDSDQSRFYKKREPIQNIPHHLVGYLAEESIADYNQSLLKIDDTSIEKYNTIQSQISSLSNLTHKIEIILANKGNIKAQNVYVSITFPDLVLVTDDQEEIADIKKILAEKALEIIPAPTYNPINVAEKELARDNKSSTYGDIMAKALGIDHNTFASLSRFQPDNNFALRTALNPHNRHYAKENRITISLLHLTHSFEKSYSNYFLIPLRKGTSTIKIELFCDEYLEPEIQEIQLTVN